MLGCKPSDIPIEVGKKSEDFGKTVNKERYQRLMGKMIYLSYTRLDIAFTISIVSQHMHSPKEAHIDIVYRILRCLKGSFGMALLFKKNKYKNLDAYADWAGLIEDRKSTIGYCTFVFGNLVS